MARAKKRAKKYPTYAYGGSVTKMNAAEIREAMKNGKLKVSRNHFAKGGELKPDYIDIDKDGNTTEPMKEAAKSVPKAQKGMKVSKAHKGMMVKGVDVSGLTKRQQKTMKKHSEHHTKKHIQEMTNAMLKGSSFTASHKAAQKKVGS